MLFLALLQASPEGLHSHIVPSGFVPLGYVLLTLGHFAHWGYVLAPAYFVYVHFVLTVCNSLKR